MPTSCLLRKFKEERGGTITLLYHHRASFLILQVASVLISSHIVLTITMDPLLKAKHAGVVLTTLNKTKGRNTGDFGVEELESTQECQH